MCKEVKPGDRVQWASHCTGGNRSGVVWSEAPTPRQWSPEIKGKRPQGVKLRAFWVTPDAPAYDGEAHTIMVRSAFREDMISPLLHESRLDDILNLRDFQTGTLVRIRMDAERNSGKVILPPQFDSYHNDARYS